MQVICSSNLLFDIVYKMSNAKTTVITSILVVFLVAVGFIVINSSNSSITEIIMPTMTPQNQGPKMIINQNKKYQVILKTEKGNITIDLYVDKMPITVNNFISLAKKGFYNNTVFHRVINGFMIQGGDPNGNGTGGPGYKFADESFEGEYIRGTIAMANSGSNTNGSQFFIIHKDYPLPKNYVIFGKVTSGIEVVDAIAESEVKMSTSGEKSIPVNPVKILSAKVVEK